MTPEEADGAIVTKIASNRLDLLVVYPKAFFPLGPSAESGLVTFVQDSVSMANDVFVNSSVDAAYNLVGVVPVTGSSQPTSGIGSALTWLDGNPTEVANLRNAFGADIVTVFVPFSWNGTTACGIATIAVRSGGFPDVSLTGVGAIALYDGVAELLAGFEGSPLAAKRDAVHHRL